MEGFVLTHTLFNIYGPEEQKNAEVKKVCWLCRNIPDNEIIMKSNSYMNSCQSVIK